MRKLSPAKAPKRERQSTVSRSATFTVSARWLASAIASVFLLAGVCVWVTLCLTFWQGSWQLLYHPSSLIVRTPSDAGISFDQIAFASSEAGIPRLRGWWCPAARPNAYTAIYFHGAKGNLGDAVESIARLHAAGLAVFAFDYRGYGQSQFAHPSQARWKEDAESAFEYLTQTRHLPAKSVVFAGDELGADLALEMGDAHPEIAGIVVAFPVSDPTSAIFEDPRARMVPAHWLVRDRWDLPAAAADLRVTSLWLCRGQSCGQDSGGSRAAQAFAAVPSPKVVVPIDADVGDEGLIEGALSRWVATLAPSR